ncbi:MAG: hypothetical protein IPP57_28000 [Candidatus Obscuribacter sp.]|nr:hypothetical protein [Candidatus Obscuribacter sp.]
MNVFLQHISQATRASFSIDANPSELQVSASLVRRSLYRLSRKLLAAKNAEHVALVALLSNGVQKLGLAPSQSRLKRIDLRFIS